MTGTVENLLNGKFDYEKGSLDFGTARIEIAIKPGEIYTGSFTIDVNSGHATEGYVFSSDYRLSIINDTFSGLHSEIGFTYRGKGLEEGDVFQGDISVISNQGEYYVPYVVTVEHETVETSLGSIKNLFHFTNLAKSDWEEAVKLFYSDSFTDIFSGNDLQYKKEYMGLSRYYGNEQNVEEFLLAINKKQPIEYIPERELVSLDNPGEVSMECINITRNGWGYTVLHAKADKPFIRLEKTEIGDNDFLGNYVSFPIYIDPDYLHGGTNYGKITFFNSFTSFEVKVVVDMDVTVKTELSRHLEFQRAGLDMLTYYEAFRTKKISVDTWIAETGHIVDRMLQLDDKNLMARLFKAQLLMTEERNNEAKWILDQAESEFQERQDFTSSLWAYYLYLTTLYNREDSYIDSITDEVWILYNNDRSQWQVAWLLLYLSEEFAVSPTKKWLFIEENIETGCISPMFYVEAVNMIIANPALLTKLTDFELRVLRYAVNNELINQEIITQVVYLASKERFFSRPLYNILKSFYEIEEDDSVLTVICELLIKGDIKDGEANSWYARAIEKELRITLLFEYFMNSLDITVENEIPKMVYLYFSYDSELDWEHNAYLYAHIITDKNEMPDIYDSYKSTIERFAVEEILKGNMNRYLAVVYRAVLDGVALTAEMADKLSRLLFVHRIAIDDEKITKVVAIQNREISESVYPVKDGVCYLPLYNRDFVILFEDGLANRYCKSIEYDLEKLMVPGKLAQVITPYIRGNLEFDVYVCECTSEAIEINEDTRERYRRILEAPEIDRDYKAEIRAHLLQYYYDNDEIRELDTILEGLIPETQKRRERANTLRFMIMRGMFDRAYDWVINYGTEEVDIKDLVKLVSKLILRNEYAADEDITRLCWLIFIKGKYDEVILRYLTEQYKGMTKDLRRLFKACENFDMEIYGLCERMLVQMLYTGYFVVERTDIYKKYVQGGARSDIQNAFLAQCSYEYFVKEQLMEDYIFEELTRAKLRNEPIQTVSKLAYLKYYSELADNVSDTVLGIIKEYLDELLDMGIYMSFFKCFMEKTTPGINKFTDKTIIEYKTEPGRRVFIHYIIEGDEEVTGEYATEEMHEMYGGVHAKAFILFFGENLLYYITEEAEGEEMLTESASISKSDISRDIYDSRFNEVNDIVIAKTLEDYDTVNKLLYDYHRHEYLIKKMFLLQ